MYFIRTWIYFSQNVLKEVFFFIIFNKMKWYSNECYCLNHRICFYKSAFQLSNCMWIFVNLLAKSCHLNFKHKILYISLIQINNTKNPHLANSCTWYIDYNISTVSWSISYGFRLFSTNGVPDVWTHLIRVRLIRFDHYIPWSYPVFWAASQNLVSFQKGE